MKVLVTGVAGQLGHDVMNELAKRGYEAMGSDIAPTYAGIQDGSPVVSMPYLSLDIIDAAAVKKTITDIAPDAVIHCAAWTAVDAAEEPENTDKVYAVNVDGTANIANMCKALNCKMIPVELTVTSNVQFTWQSHLRCTKCTKNMKENA